MTADRYSLGKDDQVANKYTKVCSASFVGRDTHLAIKATARLINSDKEHKDGVTFVS